MRAALAAGILNAWNQTVTAQEQLRVGVAATTAAEAALDGVKRGFSEGFRSNFEVIDSEQRLLSAQVLTVNARYSLYLGQATMLAFIGRLEADALVAQLPSYDPAANLIAQRRDQFGPFLPILRDYDQISRPSSKGRPAPVIRGVFPARITAAPAIAPDGALADTLPRMDGAIAPSDPSPQYLLRRTTTTKGENSMTMKHVAMMLTAPIALVSASADAAVLSFDLSGGYQASFNVDTDDLMPPAESGMDYFLLNDVAGVFGGVQQIATSISFNTLGTDGGFTIELTNGEFLGFFGPSLFTGSTSLPTFSTGQYALTSDVDGAISTLAIAAVPEPATWAMMAAGFAAVGFSMRRRKSVAADALAT